MRKIYYIFFILFLSCSKSSNKEYYDDGRIKSEFVLDENNEIKILKTYYNTGIMKSIEYYTGDKLNGRCQYFNKKGKLDLIIHYILIDPDFYEIESFENYYSYIDSFFLETNENKQSQINAILHFNVNGEVDIQKSHYFDIVLEKDTIDYSDSLSVIIRFKYRLNGVENKYRVHHFTSETQKIFSVYETNWMFVKLYDKPHNQGVNYVRGFIEEYTPFGFDTLQSVLFFKEPYYVK